MKYIPEFCPTKSPTLRCNKVKRGENDTVHACVKYLHHTTPCHFEEFPGGKLKAKAPPETLE